MNLEDLSPEQVVLDLVLKYSPRMPAMGEASVMNGQLFITARNHLKQAATFAVPVHFVGEPREGDEPRFVLRQLAHGAWKLTPSVKHPMLHAYVTIIGVPDALALLREKEASGG